MTALRVLLAGLVSALVRIRTVVAVLVFPALAPLVLLRGLLANLRLILLTMSGRLRSGFAVIVVDAISHDGSFCV